MNIENITLAKGKHLKPESGMCLLEAVSYIAGEEFSDHPACTSRVLGAFGRGLNDVLPGDKRQKLTSLIPRLIGTSGDGKDEARSYMVLDWLVRTHLPAFLDLAVPEHAANVRALAPIVDRPTAGVAGPVVRAARAAAWDAARAAAWDAAGDAAGDAARDAARDAAGAAAWDAAWDAAWAAAWAAAREAAGTVLAPTVSKLQDSAIRLFERMIDPKAEVNA